MLRKTFAVGMVSIGLAGCPGTAGSAGPASPAASALPLVARDTSLFAAVVRSIERLPGRPLHVDPRPLRGDPGLLEPSAAMLARVPPEQIQARAAVLDRLGVPETDAIADMACGVGNMRVQLDSMPASTPGCGGRQRALSVITTLPFGAATGPAALDTVTVRVFETTVDPRFGSQSAWDHVLARDPRTGAWRLVRKSLVSVAG